MAVEFFNLFRFLNFFIYFGTIVLVSFSDGHTIRSTNPLNGKHLRVIWVKQFDLIDLKHQIFDGIE